MMIMLARACISGSLTKACPSSLGTGKGGGWQCPVGCQFQDVDWTKRVCQVGPSLYLGGNGWCNHSPWGTVACTADGLVCLPGSSGRWIPGACDLTPWWKTYHRHTFRTSLLQGWQLTSLSLSMFTYWHSVLVRALLAKAMGLPFLGVLHQVLPVRHQLVLSQEVKGQSIWGWCCWRQLIWPTEKWHHRCGSKWSLCPSWAAHAEGQPKWTNQGWRDWGMWLALRTLGVWLCLWTPVRHVQHWPFLGLGGHHWHHRGSQRNWLLEPSHVFFVD